MKKNITNPAKTVLTISVGFILIFLITKWKWAISVSFIIGLIGVFSAFLSKQLDYLWMKLAWLLGLIIPNILLGIIFYIFLFPISLLSKLFGNSDPLNMKNKSDTMYKERNIQFDKASFEKPW
ncbi:MAG: hypothetical protein PHI15_09985 [Methanomicrobium sp.]|jgi:fatty acid desaturase|nr:hypothetical protein [Methanomicrobium sp.]